MVGLVILLTVSIILTLIILIEYSTERRHAQTFLNKTVKTSISRFTICSVKHVEVVLDFKSIDIYTILTIQNNKQEVLRINSRDAKLIRK